MNNAEEKELSGIVSFESANAQEIFEFLKINNIVATVREGIVRFSPHFYNNEEEIHKIVDCLKRFV